MINVRTENAKPNIGIRSWVPNTRVSNFQTTRSGESATTGNIAAGTPIGLLLALTYAVAQVTTQTLGPLGERPTVRIN